MGVSLFTGRMKVFLLISVAGARLSSPWNAMQKQIHTYVHRVSENENFVVLKMSDYYGQTLKSCKEFPLESDRATCAVRIGCRLLSRPEGLGPEIALKSPEENKRGSWLLRRNLKVYYAFFILHLFWLDLRFQDMVFS